MDDKNKYLAKNDDFVLAKYDFKLETQKLFFACLYKMNSNYIKPIENQLSFIYELNFEEIKKIIGIDYAMENNKDVIKRAKKDLTEKVIEIKIKNGYIITGIIKTFKVDEVEKTVLIEIAKEILPFFVDTFKKFTKFGFKHLSLCKSKYTFRLYEILITKSKKIEKNQKNIKYSINELKELLQIPKSYDYTKFKNRVLEKAKLEYNAEDIENAEEKEEKKLFKNFKYTEIKEKKRGRGRKAISHIIFEFELLEETKLLMMSKTKKLKKELEKEDWIFTKISLLIDKNKERELFFKSLEKNYIYSFFLKVVEEMKKIYNINGVINQQLLNKTLGHSFSKFDKKKYKNVRFEEFLKKGLEMNINFYLENDKSLEEI